VSTSNEASTLPAFEEPKLISRDGDEPNAQSSAAEPNKPVWGTLAALLFWVASILVQGIIPLFFVIPFALRRGLNPSAPDFSKALVKLATTDPTAVLLQVVSILPTHLVILAMLWALVTRFGKRPFLASFGWGWSGRLRLWQSVGLGIGLFIVANVIASLLGTEKPTPFEQLINSSMGARYTLAVLAVFTAPFVEEFVYRGVVYSALQRTIGIYAAVFFAWGLFTAVHVPQYWPNLGVIAAVGLLSLVLTVVRARSGKLLPCIVIHMSFNAVQAVILVVEPFIKRALPPTEPVAPTVSMLLPWIRLIF
jgi:membrane protease YdiL (CAAX protease family)